MKGLDLTTMKEIRAVVILYMAFTLPDFRVMAEVTFEDTPTNVSAVVGETAKLPCIINGLDPATYVLWIEMKTANPYSIGRLIYTSDARFGFTSTSDTDWSVFIRDVKLSDQGIFTCLTNTRPKKSRNIHLTILSPPKITSSSVETTSVLTGDSVELTCNGEGSPPPRVSWYEGSLTNRNMVGTRATLLIDNITGTLGGKYQGYREYQCSLDNGVPPVASRQFRVNVQSAPNLQLVTPSDTIVPTGNDVIMTIRCTGSPSPWVYWFHDGHALNQGDRYKIDSQEGFIHSLTITGVNEDEFGFYRVQCTNRLGHAGAVFQIKQLVPPDIDLTRSSGNQTVYLGDSLNVSCYSSSETAMFNWYKSGDQDIKQSPIGSGNTLTFPSIKASDAGLYVCMTGNLVGYTTHHIGITIRDITTESPVPTTAIPANTTNPAARSDIECESNVMSLHVPLNLLPVGQQVTWNDPSCVVADNGTHLTGSIGLGDCGTFVVFNNTHVTFENELVSHAGPGNGTSRTQSGIDFGAELNSVVVVQCVYPRREQGSIAFRPIPGHVRFYEKTLGHMEVRMRQARDLTFADTYESQSEPHKVHLNDQVFIKLSTDQGNVTTVAINVDRCLATPSSSPLDTDFQELTNNGCPAISSVTIHSSPASEVHLSFHAFQFTNHPGAPVYVHCEVYVCPLSNPHCVAGCTDTVARSRRAATGGIRTHLVSTGPFPVVDEKEEGVVGQSTALIAVTGLCACLAVVATVFGILAWKGRRRLTAKETVQ